MPRRGRDAHAARPRARLPASRGPRADAPRAACTIVHGAAGATATANATTKSTNVRRTTNDQGPFLIQREHRTSFRLRQCIARDEAGERVSCWIWATMSSEGIRIIAVRATVGEGTRSREVSLRARSAALSAIPQAPLPAASERTSPIKASWHPTGSPGFGRRRAGTVGSTQGWGRSPEGRYGGQGPRGHYRGTGGTTATMATTTPVQWVWSWAWPSDTDAFPGPVSPGTGFEVASPACAP